MDSIRLQADFVVVSPNRVLHPGQVVIRHGRVMEIANATRATADIDLGGRIILPGLVNPHTHLEFSELKQPLPAGNHFAEWIANVIRYRTARLAGQDNITQRASILAQGADECFTSGTALIADIVTRSTSGDDLPYANTVALSTANAARRIPPSAWAEHLASCTTPRLFAFPEMAGLSPERIRGSAAWAHSMLDELPALQGAGTVFNLGVSPHAPYSTHYPTIEGLCQQFGQHITFAMHVAESLEERQWTQAGTGPFQLVFEQLDIPQPKQRLQISGAIELLQRQQRALLIHGNYLTSSEMDSIAAGGSISIVYCPRTHEHFGHSAYPLNELRRRGIRVVLGTDSRASNPDLNLWNEMLTARRKHPDFDARSALAAITTEAAAALGCQADFGSLEVGSLAFLNTIALDGQPREEQLLEALTSHTQPILPLSMLTDC